MRTFFTQTIMLFILGMVGTCGGDIDPEILKALDSQNTKQMEALLEKGASAQGTDDYGRSVLMFAIKQNNVELAKLAIKNGVDINAQSSWSNDSALTLAIEANKPNLVKLLLAHNAHVNTKHKNGMTPLILAVRKHNPELVKILLDKDATIDTQDKNGMTALLYALDPDRFDTQRERIANLLLTKGANINLKTKEGTPIWFYFLGRKTTSQERINLITFLLKNGVDVHAKDKAGKDALAYAQNPQIKALLKARMKPRR